MRRDAESKGTPQHHQLLDLSLRFSRVKTLGHVCAKFMIVCQRYSLNGCRGDTGRRSFDHSSQTRDTAGVRCRSLVRASSFKTMEAVEYTDCVGALAEHGSARQTRERVPLDFLTNPAEDRRDQTLLRCCGVCDDECCRPRRGHHEMPHAQQANRRSIHTGNTPKQPPALTNWRPAPGPFHPIIRGPLELLAGHHARCLDSACCHRSIRFLPCRAPLQFS